MADTQDILDVLENRLMRAWLHGDRSDAKKLIANDGLFMFGTTPPALLDRPSFLAAMDGALTLDRYRFDVSNARRHRNCAWFTGRVELEMRVGGTQWRGAFLLCDLWSRSRIRRHWNLVERGLAPLTGEDRYANAIRGMQLWR